MLQELKTLLQLKRGILKIFRVWSRNFTPFASFFHWKRLEKNGPLEVFKQFSWPCNFMEKSTRLRIVRSYLSNQQFFLQLMELIFFSKSTSLVSFLFEWISIVLDFAKDLGTGILLLFWRQGYRGKLFMSDTSWSNILKVLGHWISVGGQRGKVFTQSKRHPPWLTWMIGIGCERNGIFGVSEFYDSSIFCQK